MFAGRDTERRTVLDPETWGLTESLGDHERSSKKKKNYRIDRQDQWGYLSKTEVSDEVLFVFVYKDLVKFANVKIKSLAFLLLPPFTFL